MTESTPIPPDRLEAAKRALVDIRMFPNRFSEHKQWAWDALDALDPELAMLPPLEAYNRMRED